MNNNKVEVYSIIVDFMKTGCDHQTCQKLDLLKTKIKQGFQSPIAESLTIFGTNLFIFDFETYQYMVEELNGSLS